MDALSIPAGSAAPAPGTQPRQGPSVSVCRVSDAEVELLAAFYRRVWDPDATADGVRAARRYAARMNPVTPGEAPPTFLFVAGDKAIGHVTTIPVQVWGGGREHGVHWIKGLMVLPEHRHGAVGFMLLREAVRHVGPAMAMVVEPEARRLFGALGFADLGALANLVNPLRPSAVLRRLDLELLGIDASSAWVRTASRLGRSQVGAWAGGVGARVALGTYAETVGRVPSRHRMRYNAPDSADLERLWKRMRNSVSACTSRDPGQLRLRYGAYHGESYIVAGVSSPGLPIGAAVVRRPRPDGDPRLNGIRVSVLSEVICAPNAPDALLATIATAERTAREARADLLLASASDERLASALKRRGFVPAPPNVHFLTRLGSSDLDAPEALERWWLTRGDSGADEAF